MCVSVWVCTPPFGQATEKILFDVALTNHSFRLRLSADATIAGRWGRRGREARGPSHILPPGFRDFVWTV